VRKADDRDYFNVQEAVVNGRHEDRTKSHKQAVGFYKCGPKHVQEREQETNEISQGTKRKPQKAWCRKKT
jgi:hypothetical protein